MEKPKAPRIPPALIVNPYLSFIFGSMRNRKKCLSWSTIVEKMKNQKRQKEENIHSQEPGKFPKNCINNNNEANTIINNLGAGEKKEEEEEKKNNKNIIKGKKL